jgi:hypothetical protein
MFWGCFRPFCYCTKVDAKLAELAPLTHKSAKRSSVGTFRNERSRSTPLDPKLIFWGHFGPFQYCMKVDAKLPELAPLTYKFTKWSYIGTFRNQGTQSTPLDPKLIFRSVSDHSELVIKARLFGERLPILRYFYFPTVQKKPKIVEFFPHRNPIDPFEPLLVLLS